MFKDNKKVSLVTRARNGIGFALAKNLLSYGWTIFGTGRQLSNLEEIIWPTPININKKTRLLKRRV